jgi:hypothetical protein
MNCYDCSITGHDTPAVATCIHCGAGLCIEHAIVAPHHLTRPGLINRLETVEPPARLVHCETCAAAHDAAAGPRRHGKAS